MYDEQSQSGTDLQVIETKADPSATNLEQAREVISLGYSVLPIRVGGSKSQVKRTWKQYQKRLYTNEELEGDWTFLGDGVQ